MTLTLALTGATGFVGGHTLAEALRRGHRVRALARRPQPPREGVQWIAGSLTDAPALAELVHGAEVLVHVAGVTNARTPAGFDEGNPIGTAFLRRAAGPLPAVIVSSLAARAPWLSRYGASKLAAEGVARGFAGPVTLIRPPAVYGPGDREFLPLFRLARFGLLPVPARARAAMIYGPDLAEALVALAEDMAGPKRAAGQTFEIDDGAGGHPQPAIARAIAQATGRSARPVEVPAAVLKAAAALDTSLARLKGDLPGLSFDRARYLAHPDWTADSAPLRALGIWQPATSLHDGLAATAIWYRETGLLP
ncbi:MAG: NAD-dependent epimerase/dehydratase family protein [Sphingomonadaceae bacterium]